MLDQEMMDLMWAGIRSYRMERKFPALLTDDQLAAITVPVPVHVTQRRPARAHATLTERTFREGMTVMSQCDHADVRRYGLSADLAVLAWPA
jgi:hypothetical protein